MKPSLRTALSCSTLALLFAGVTTPRAVGVDDPAQDKSEAAFYLDEVLQQLRLYPKDAYLQYVTLQLARCENRVDEIAGQIGMLRGNEAWNQRAGRRDQVDLFNIFTGALAIQESLQLDTMRGGARARPMQPRFAVPPGGDQREAIEAALEALELRRQEVVEVASLTGPTIQSHPWKQMLGSQKPDVGPLARKIPEDFFFAEFGSLPKLQAAENADANVKRNKGKSNGVEYVHLTSADRTVQVYSACPEANLHVRSNSLAALERVLAAVNGKTADGRAVRRLGDTSEFAYIRTLMPRGGKEEDGFLYLSDAFIRRLVGPSLKLTERRRVLCYNHLRMIGHASLMYRSEFGRVPDSLEALEKAKCAPGVFGKDELACPNGGEYSLSADGTTGICSHHGHAHDLVPCVEHPVAQVTGVEADEYNAFLTEYYQYWRTFFDPIGIRIKVSPERYRLETIVLPLIDNTVYSGLSMTLGGKAEPLDPLPVPDRNIFTVSFRFDKDGLAEQAGLKEPEPDSKQEKLAGNNVAPGKSVSNLQQIGLALHNYHSANARFPTQAIFSKEGKPLLSWRVMLLPFVNEAPLYNEFHLDEPWDSAHNKKLADRIPAVYQSLADKAKKTGTAASGRA